MGRFVNRLVDVLVIGTCLAALVFMVTSAREVAKAAAASETKLCGTVTALTVLPSTGTLMAIVDNATKVPIPEPVAYKRLVVGEVFTFYFRPRIGLVAFEPGNDCK